MLVLLLAVPTFLTTSTALPIVDSGQPRAVIAPVAADAPAETKRAVAELQRVVEKMTGAKLRVGAEPGSPTIHVGRDTFVERADLNLDELDTDGFVMATVDENDLVLAGRNPHGTEFAVYRFLQKYGGVRWYLPTELGEVVPSRASFSVGKLADREEPSFHSRLWSSAARFDRGTWERHNFCRGRYSFHHNLLHVFVPSKLGDSHPEWFPEIDGRRRVPQDDSGQRGVELRGAEASCVLQSIPVKPGEMYLASVYVRGKTSGQPESGLLIQWQDAAGKWFSAPKRSDRLPGGLSKDWLRLQTFAKVPAGAGRLVFCVTAYGQKPGESLEIDDAALRRLPQ